MNPLQLSLLMLSFACSPQANPTDSPSAAATVGNATAQNLFVGADKSCVVFDDKRAFCWGGDAFGSLGMAAETQICGTPKRPYPCAKQPQLLAIDNPIDLAPASRQMCSLDGKKVIRCWGQDDIGSLGHPPETLEGGQLFAGITRTCKTMPVTGNTECSQPEIDENPLNEEFPCILKPITVHAPKTPSGIETHGNTLCLVAEGTQERLCWGRDEFGDRKDRQKCRQREECTYSPKPFASQNVKQMTPRDLLLADGRIERHEPRNKRFLKMDKTVHHMVGTRKWSCAIVGDERSASCWGRSDGPQFGIGPTKPGKFSGVYFEEPNPVMDLTNLVDLQIGEMGKHVCALDADGAVWCWGSGTQGQLGTGDKADRDRPTKVKLPKAKQIGVGSFHTCALTEDQQVYCWGANHRGSVSTSDDMCELEYAADKGPGACQLSPKKVAFQ